MTDLELGEAALDAVGITSPRNGERFFLRWCNLRKSVKQQEDKIGLMQSSISNSISKSSSFPAASTTSEGQVKIILNNVSGAAFPGELLALMGPSGSGKTSLLDALSGRSAFEDGLISINGTEVVGPVMKRFKRKVAYVKQADIFFGHLSVRDQLTYTALLRLPSTMAKSEKHDEVSRILSLLRLDNCADTPIRLVSGGEKKRVNIGTELLTDPYVIILDEPTSGLDSTSAVALMKILHRLAKNNGKTIITSIHQPSSAVFRAFDKLMMLAEGNVVYYGNPAESLDYLRCKDLECPNGYNAADHWMDLLVADSAIEGSDGYHFSSPNSSRVPLTSLANNSNEDEEKKNDDDAGINKGYKQNRTRERLIESWDAEAFATKVKDDIQNDKKKSSPRTSIVESVGRKYNISWKDQFLVLVHRCLRNSRSAIFTPLNITKSACIGLVIGLLWFQIEYTEERSRDLVSYFFFTMTYWVFDSMFNSLMSFPAERSIIYKERASGSYYLSAYFLAKSVSEAPTRVALPGIYMIISYWIAGINPRFDVFLGCTGACLLATVAGESYGLMIGACVMDFEKSLVVMVIVGLTLMVLGGFFISTVPKWVTWLKFLSPFKYAFDASQQMVFDRDLPCDGSNLLDICKGSDISSVTPEQIINQLNAQGSIGFNILMLFVLFVVTRYIAYIFLSKKQASERL